MIKKKIDGFTFYLNPDDHGISKRMIITKGRREPGYRWILLKEASGIAYDIGANLGQYTLHLSKLCTHVVAFEPDPRSLKLLKKNVKGNKLSNVCIKQMAIVEWKRTVNMLLAKKPNLSREMPLDAPPKGSGVFVDGISIDEYEKGNNWHPTFIKMDIEGGEVNALRGAMKTLKEAREMKILIEVHPDQYNKDNDFRAVLEELLKMGYYFKYVVNAKGKIKKFKDYKCVKKFSYYKHRAVFCGIPDEKVLKWATEMPKDGKKVIRSLLLVK